MDAATTRDQEIHLVLDNYGTHKHAKVRAWFAKRPRYHLHFTPVGASWLNLVECFFSQLTRRRIRRGTFRSVVTLKTAIDQYVREHNTNPKPFVWTKTAATINKKVRRCKEALDSEH